MNKKWSIAWPQRAWLQCNSLVQLLVLITDLILVHGVFPRNRDTSTVHVSCDVDHLRSNTGQCSWSHIKSILIDKSKTIPLLKLQKILCFLLMKNKIKPELWHGLQQPTNNFRIIIKFNTSSKQPSTSSLIHFYKRCVLNH